MFQDLSHLKQFDISNNNLTALKENVFKQVDNLESINLTKNLIHEIDSNIFSKLKKLKILDLSSNNLKSDNFLPHDSLKYLNLSYNKYLSLNQSAVLDLEVELFGNLWNCRWLLEKIVSESSNSYHFSKQYLVNTTDDVLHFDGIDCSDDERGQMRNFIIVKKNTECNVESFKVNCGYINKRIFYNIYFFLIASTDKYMVQYKEIFNSC